MENTKTGLWKTESKKGTKYYKGKIKIGDKEYQVSVFKNDKKNDKSPDLMLYVNEKVEKEKTSFTIDEAVYDIKDEDLAF